MEKTVCTSPQQVLDFIKGFRSELQRSVGDQKDKAKKEEICTAISALNHILDNCIGRELIMGWKVEVVEYEIDEVIHTVEAQSQRHAEKVQAGMDINLDHDKYFTRIVGEGEDGKPES